MGVCVDGFPNIFSGLQGSRNNTVSPPQTGILHSPFLCQDILYLYELTQPIHFERKEVSTCHGGSECEM